jgi:hypothetical protein
VYAGPSFTREQEYASSDYTTRYQQPANAAPVTADQRDGTHDAADRYKQPSRLFFVGSRAARLLQLLRGTLWLYRR